MLLYIALQSATAIWSRNVDSKKDRTAMVNTVYNAAISGLQAASLKLKVSANNVANANTDGYQKQQVTTQTGTYGVEVKVEKVSTVESPNNNQSGGELRPDAPSNVDVAEELLEMKAAQNLFEANLKTLNTNDNMLGRILDIEAWPNLLTLLDKLSSNDVTAEPNLNIPVKDSDWVTRFYAA